MFVLLPPPRRSRLTWRATDFFAIFLLSKEMFMQAVFITSNPHKLREAIGILGVETLFSQALDMPEIQSFSLEEIVKHKAEYAYEKIGKANHKTLKQRQ